MFCKEWPAKPIGLINRRLYHEMHSLFPNPNYKLTLGLYRGSYMSAHVLLNFSNKLGKRDKMRGLPSILSLFRNKFYKFNNTRA